MHQVVYAKSAVKDLKGIERQVARRILKKIYEYSQQENPLKFAKPIKDVRLGEYRFRIGEYRVLFDVDKNGKIYILMILRIKHRKDVYK